MGEIADDLVQGGCCMACSLYFKSEHGYPVLCELCWDKEYKDPDTGETWKVREDHPETQKAHLKPVVPYTELYDEPEQSSTASE